MSIKEHDPISSKPPLMSPTKRAWWAGLRKNPSKPDARKKQPRMAVLFYIVASASRPSDPDETLLWGCVGLNKLHDKEPELIVTLIEKIDPNFFDSYPREPSTALNMTFKKAQVGEACRSFFKHGLASYGKPGLRKTADPPSDDAPLAAL